MLDFALLYAKLAAHFVAFVLFHSTSSMTCLIICLHLCHVRPLCRLSDLFLCLHGRLYLYRLHGAHHLCHPDCSAAGFAVDLSRGQQSRLAPAGT